MSTTIIVGLDGACSGGGHAQISASVEGGATAHFVYGTDELLASITAEEVQDALRVLLRWHFRGKTRAQAGTELQAGITLVI